MCIRDSANAGHTIVNDYGKFALHTLPSGVFYDHTTSIIGNGVALNIPVFFKEYQEVVDLSLIHIEMCIRDRCPPLYTAGQTGETSEGCKSRLLLLQYPG